MTNKQTEKSMQDRVIAGLANELGIPKVESNKILRALAVVVSNELVAGNDLRLPGIGRLKLITHAARIGRNVRTDGAPVPIPARKVVKLYIKPSVLEAVRAAA